MLPWSTFCYICCPAFITFFEKTHHDSFQEKPLPPSLSSSLGGAHLCKASGCTSYPGLGNGGEDTWFSHSEQILGPLRVSSRFPRTWSWTGRMGTAAVLLPWVRAYWRTEVTQSKSSHRRERSQVLTTPFEPGSCRVWSQIHSWTFYYIFSSLNSGSFLLKCVWIVFSIMCNWKKKIKS